MADLKRYTIALALAALALLFLIVSGLGFTVWAPSSQIQATGKSSEPFVMTRTGVLPLYNEDVTVTVTSKDPEQAVWLAVGSAQDIVGWLGDKPYDEVIGLDNLETLKFIDVAGTGEEQQSGDTEQEPAGEPSADPLASDMWSDLQEGKGTLTAKLSNQHADKSLLAATNGVDPAPTLTLTWEVTKTNLVAWAALVVGIVFAVFAALSAWSVYRQQRRRRLRAERLRRTIMADSTQTTMIPVVPSVQDLPDEAVEEADEEIAEVDTAALEEDPGDLIVSADGEVESAAQETDTTETDATDETPGETTEDTTSTAELSPVAERGEDLTGPGQDDKEDVVEPEAATQAVASAPERVETITTDSGMINLSALQGGGMFPTRQALRDAQTRGVDRVLVEGYEFVVGAETAHQRSAADDEAISAASELLGKRSSRGSNWRKAFHGRKGRGPSQQENGNREGSSK